MNSQPEFFVYAPNAMPPQEDPVWKDALSDLLTERVRVNTSQTDEAAA